MKGEYMKQTSRQSIFVQVKSRENGKGNIRVHEPVARDTGSGNMR